MWSVLVSLVLALRATGRTPVALQLEILALRHQLQVLERSRPEDAAHQYGPTAVGLDVPRLGQMEAAVVIVKPEAVLAWNRRGFRLFWPWKSRRLAAAAPRSPVSSMPIARQRRTNVGADRPGSVRALPTARPPSASSDPSNVSASITRILEFAMHSQRRGGIPRRIGRSS
jgi:hypothetical protein